MSRVTHAPAETCILLAMSILKTIIAALSTTPQRTGEELRQDRRSIDMSALEARVAELEADRKRLLLSGGDGALHANSADLANARLDVERAAALIAELDRLAVEAEAREAAAALQADAEVAQREADKLAQVCREIDGLAGQIRDRLAIAAVSLAAVTRWNARAAKVAPERKLPATPLEVVRRRILDKVA